MPSSYQQWRAQFSPPWWMTGGGPPWNLGFGQVEDATVTQCVQSVEVRYPDFAPLDAGGGTSAALGYILNDRQLEPAFGDDANLDATRLYLKSGFSQGAAGQTRSWLPMSQFNAGDMVGAAGLVWSCTVGGVTGAVSPFGTSVSLPEIIGAGGVGGSGTFTVAMVSWTTNQFTGFFLTDSAQSAFEIESNTSTVLTLSSGTPANGAWIITDPNGAGPGAAVRAAAIGTVVVEPTGVAWSAIARMAGNGGVAAPSYLVAGPNPGSTWQTCPNAPGWYWAGTNQGLIDALVKAGFWSTLPGGGMLLPRIVNNRDFENIDTALTGVSVVGGVPTDTSLVLTFTSGTAGASGTVQIQNDSSTGSWSSGQNVFPGYTRSSANSDIYLCVVGGTTGSISPFPASTPADSTWPPTPGQVFSDNGVQWVLATFSPIPLALPVGETWGLAFSGPFSTGGGGFQIQPNPPDGDTAAWSRIWLVLPGNNVAGAPRLWGFTGQMERTAGSSTLTCTVTNEGTYAGPVAVGIFTTSNPANNLIAISDTSIYSQLMGQYSGSSPMTVTVSGPVAPSDPYPNPVLINLLDTSATTGILQIYDEVTFQYLFNGTISLTAPYTDPTTGLTLTFETLSSATSSYQVAWYRGNYAVVVDVISSFGSPYTDSTTGISFAFTGTGQPGDVFELGWLWGEPPAGETLPAIWGQGTTANAYGLIWQICQRWLGAHELLMGAWIVAGDTTAFDSIPTFTPWNPGIDVTFGGENAPYFIYGA